VHITAPKAAILCDQSDLYYGNAASLVWDEIAGLGRRKSI